jgi:hypothetical protein
MIHVRRTEHYILRRSLFTSISLNLQFACMICISIMLYFWYHVQYCIQTVAVPFQAPHLQFIIGPVASSGCLAGAS